MKRITISEYDGTLFNSPFNSSVCLIFQDYVKEIRRMVKQQGEGFWIQFVTSFRSYAVNNRGIENISISVAEDAFIDMLKMLTSQDNLIELSALVRSLHSLNLALLAHDYNVVMNPVLRFLFTRFSKPFDTIKLYFRFLTSIVVLFTRWQNTSRARSRSPLAMWKPPTHWQDTNLFKEYKLIDFELYLKSQWGKALPKLLRLDKEDICWLQAERENVQARKKQQPRRKRFRRCRENTTQKEPCETNANATDQNNSCNPECNSSRNNGTHKKSEAGASNSGPAKNSQDGLQGTDGNSSISSKKTATVSKTKEKPIDQRNKEDNSNFPSKNTVGITKSEEAKKVKQTHQNNGASGVVHNSNLPSKKTISGAMTEEKVGTKPTYQRTVTSDNSNIPLKKVIGVAKTEEKDRTKLTHQSNDASDIVHNSNIPPKKAIGVGKTKEKDKAIPKHKSIGTSDIDHNSNIVYNKGSNIEHKKGAVTGSPDTNRSKLTEVRNTSMKQSSGGMKHKPMQFVSEDENLETKSETKNKSCDIVNIAAQPKNNSRGIDGTSIISPSKASSHVSSKCNPSEVTGKASGDHMTGGRMFISMKGGRNNKDSNSASSQVTAQTERKILVNGSSPSVEGGNMLKGESNRKPNSASSDVSEHAEVIRTSENPSPIIASISSNVAVTPTRGKETKENGIIKAEKDFCGGSMFKKPLSRETTNIILESKGNLGPLPKDDAVNGSVFKKHVPKEMPSATVKSNDNPKQNDDVVNGNVFKKHVPKEMPSATVKSNDNPKQNDDVVNGNVFKKHVPKEMPSAKVKSNDNPKQNDVVNGSVFKKHVPKEMPSTTVKSNDNPKQNDDVVNGNVFRKHVPKEMPSTTVKSNDNPKQNDDVVNGNVFKKHVPKEMPSATVKSNDNPKQNDDVVNGNVFKKHVPKEMPSTTVKSNDNPNTISKINPVDGSVFKKHIPKDMPSSAIKREDIPSPITKIEANSKCTNGPLSKPETVGDKNAHEKIKGKCAGNVEQKYNMKFMKEQPKCSYKEDNTFGSTPVKSPDKEGSKFQSAKPQSSGSSYGRPLPPPRQTKKTNYLYYRCDTCNILESNLGIYMRCGLCVSVKADRPRIYCSKHCQFVDWKRHHRKDHAKDHRNPKGHPTDSFF